MANRKDKQGHVLRTGESQKTNGRYRFRWQECGKQKEINANTLQELREKEKEVRKNLDNGISGLSGSRVTLNDEIKVYLDSKQNLKNGTKNGYLKAWRLHIENNIGRQKIKNLKYSTMKKFYLKLANEKDLSMSTIKGIHSVLHPTFRLAVRDGLIPSNPVDSLFGEIKKDVGKKPKKCFALTIQEQEAFISHIKNTPKYNYLYPFFAVMLATGCRIGELLALTWDDVDYDNNVISINHASSYLPNLDTGKYEWHISTPKTNAGTRTIPLLSETRQALNEQRKLQFQLGQKRNFEIDGYKGFVFTGENGLISTPSNVCRIIFRIVDDYNKLEEQQAKKEHRKPQLLRRFSAHSLRHTFCTRLVEQETNLKVVQSIMDEIICSILDLGQPLIDDFIIEYDSKEYNGISDCPTYPYIKAICDCVRILNQFDGRFDNITPKNFIA